MTELASKTCVPCKGGTPPLKGEELDELSRQVPEWEVVEEHYLSRRFRFRNFRESLRFINEVGELAEEQGHHPDISFGWGYAEITVWTHKIDGLTESDFIFAAKVDTLHPAA
jgi:4a-hydroxytetrahydrobiopterin dehydratase